METFSHQGRLYLTIKHHSFQVLNGFAISNPVLYQVVAAQRSGDVIQEYLGKSWELMRSQVNGERIHTLYNKSYFSYSRESVSKVVFLAPTLPGAQWLALYWLLNRQGIEPKPDLIQLGLQMHEQRSSILYTADRLWDDQRLHACYIDVNESYWNERFLEQLHEQYAEQQEATA